MATAEDYASWIVANKDKQGTPEFETVAQAYKIARAQMEQAPQQASSLLGGGVAGGIAQGMRDPIDAAAAMLPKGLQAITSLGGYAPNRLSEFLGQEAARVQAGNKANEQQYEQERAQEGRSGMDVARFAGNVASPANLAPAGLANALRAGNTLKGAAALGATAGAVTGGDVNSEDYWIDKAKDVGLGAAGGAAVQGALGGLARVVRPQTNQQAQALIDQGVNLTPGQIAGGRLNAIEEKLQSLPIVGESIASSRQKGVQEFNKAALNRVLEPIGETVSKVGREGIQEVESKISAVYNNLLPKLQFIPDQQFTQDLGALRQAATGLAETEQKKFNFILNDVMSKASPSGGMAGETLKTVESVLTNKAKQFEGGSGYEKELSEALNETLRIFRANIERSNPQFANELKAANTAWANYARVRQAASSTNAGANEGVFTPAQLAMAVRSQDKSAGKGASAKGLALMQDLAEQGTQVMGTKVPDSGTAGRLGYGLGGAAAVFNPTAAAGVLAGALPYVGPLRGAATAAMTKRPQKATELAAAIRKTSPYLSGAAPLSIQRD